MERGRPEALPLFIRYPIYGMQKREFLRVSGTQALIIRGWDITYILSISSIFYITIQTASTASPTATMSSASAAGTLPTERMAAFLAAYPP